MASDTPKTARAAFRLLAGPVSLAHLDPGGRPLPTKKDKPKTKAKVLADLQERLWAESTVGGRRRVLLVLQGMDTAGKGGVTEHVVGACGPIGVQYTAFKAPTDEEQQHPFLWRIERKVPGPGIVGVFDRSHYEDVLIVRVHDLVPESEWQGRYDEINAFEAKLVQDGVTIIKCFLHISYDTQRERLLARLNDPDKHWKFHESDIDERGYWGAYVAAYEAALERCNTDAAPWYVIPSDDKDYRNWAVGRLLHETLEAMDLQYPRPKLDRDRLQRRLEPE
ncbi:MAG: PPK2 family polyphosphate kinase [Jatrophihabitans sp.]|uniref:PPK2 family polyphosphate kinase n=1 Tax=Jatrophihabitans sp. TaxID=1932789 RepID=UPI003F7DFC08